MPDHKLRADGGTLQCTFGDAELSTRYNFTAQYIAGAVLLAHRARTVEDAATAPRREVVEHRASVVGAVMQAVAAIETELSSVVHHGPGHHLGSAGIDTQARSFLAPLAATIDRERGLLKRWNLVLYLLGRTPVTLGSWPGQDAQLLVDLRNELVHYRSNPGGRTKKQGLLVGLRAKGFRSPPFISPGSNEFPLHVLCADCAEWAAFSAAAFVDAASMALETSSPLDAHRASGAGLEGILPAAGQRWRSRC